MNDRLMADILWTQAGRLNQGSQTDYTGMFPEFSQELGPLLALATKVKRALIPVRVTPAFREALRSDLMAAYAREQGPSWTSRLPRWEWVLGAAAIGSAMSIAGVVAYRRRNRPAEPKAETLAGAG